MKKKIIFWLILNGIFFNESDALNPDSIITYNNSKSEIFFRFLYSMPVGAFGNKYAIDSTDLVTESITKTIEGKNGGFGANSGFGAEAGGYFYFYQKQTKNSYGVMVSFLSYATNSFRWESDTQYIFQHAKYSSLKFISFKAGPCMRKVLNDYAAIRFYYQAGAIFSSKGGWEFNDNYSEVEGGVTYEIEDHSWFRLNGGSGIKHELGVVFNYHWFIAGLSYSIAKISYNDVEFYRSVNIQAYNNYNGTFLGSDADHISEHFAAKAPTNFWSVSLGIKFGK